jgi:hypothetical protein
MSDSPGTSVPRDVITLQLSLLDVYEALLSASAWDETKVNTVLKTFMASGLALMRLQQSISGELVPAQKEMIQQYRARLEEWLAQHAEATERGTAP